MKSKLPNKPKPAQTCPNLRFTLMKRARRRTLLQELLLLPLCKSSTNVRPTGQSHASYSKGLDIDEHVRHFRGRSSSDILRGPQIYEKNLPISLMLSNVKGNGRLFLIFVAFSEYLDYMKPWRNI